MAALTVALYWFSLTASVAAPLPKHNWSVPPTTVRCIGTLIYLRADAVRQSARPRVIVALDVTRADRCAGQFGRPVGRLHGYLVLTRDALALRTHLRAAQPSFWVRACQRLRPACLNMNTLIRWTRPAALP